MFLDVELRLEEKLNGELSSNKSIVIVDEMIT